MSKTHRLERQKAIVITTTSLLVALFSPVGMRLISHPYGDFAANLIGVFWTVFIGSPIPVDGGEIVPPASNPITEITTLPLIALPLLFVFQLYRTYNGQSSTGTAILWGVLSELFLVIISVPSYIISVTIHSIAGLYLPFPILLLVGTLFLRKSPPFVPSAPWETLNESDSILPVSNAQ